MAILSKSKTYIRKERSDFAAQKLARIPVGEQRNFCFAETRRPVSRSCGGLNLYKPCRRIKAGERCSPLPPFVGLPQDWTGKQVRAVEGASPYMVCKVHNKVRITQIKMRNENRSALVSYQIIFPPHITMSGDTITSRGSPLNRVRSASSPVFTEPTRSDMPAISAAVQVIASMPFS